MARLDIAFTLALDLPGVAVGILIRDRLGNDIYRSIFPDLGLDVMSGTSGVKLLVSLTLPLNLGVRNYSVAVALGGYRSHMKDCLDWIEQALVFQIFQGDRPQFIGCTQLAGGGSRGWTKEARL